MQRGNVSLSNLQFLNAVLYVAEHGCKWRGLPKRFGNWHTIYTRMNRGPRAEPWIVYLRNCNWNRSFAFVSKLQLDSTSVKVHRTAGTLKKTDHKASANLGWMDTKIHMVRGCSDRNNVRASRNAMMPEGANARDWDSGMPVIMDRAYEGNETVSSSDGDGP